MLHLTAQSAAFQLPSPMFYSYFILSQNSVRLPTIFSFSLWVVRENQEVNCFV